jgi:hypothetical protein
MHLVLSCYIERRDDWWEAACPHLSFSARGRSFLHAHERLGRQIRAYVKHVEALPEKERPAFYDRRATVWARLRLTLSVVLASLSPQPRKKRGHHRITYTFDFAT